MMLDLDELTLGWDCPPGELRARAVVGRDGDELIQLRVDLGVMQMCRDGRPDGQRYRGLPTAREYIEHELRIGGRGSAAAGYRQRTEGDGRGAGESDWRELERELSQLNYRRLALMALAEDALRADDAAGGRRWLELALRDTEACQAEMELLGEHGAAAESSTPLRAALVLDRARLLTQLRVVEGEYEDAVEQAEAGAGQLSEALAEVGYDEEQRESDAGVRYLRELSASLRRDYGIARTLTEQLDEALEKEDFETAAQIRDKLARRRESPGGPPAGG